MNPKSAFILMGFLFVLFGLIMAGVSTFLGLRKRSRMKSGTKTTGVVVNNETMSGMRNDYGGRSTLFKPTVRFQTTDGRIVDYTPQVSTNTANYAVGQNVEIYYNPQNPQDAVIGISSFGWFRFIAFALGGAFFALFGAFFALIGLFT